MEERCQVCSCGMADAVGRYADQQIDFPQGFSAEKAILHCTQGSEGTKSGEWQRTAKEGPGACWIGVMDSRHKSLLCFVWSTSTNHLGLSRLFIAYPLSGCRSHLVISLCFFPLQHSSRHCGNSDGSTGVHLEQQACDQAPGHLLLILVRVGWPAGSHPLLHHTGQQ